MTTASDSCPADHVLAEFAQGVLDEPELLRVARHLDRCEACRSAAAAAAAAVGEPAGSPSEEPTVPEIRSPLLAPSFRRGSRLGRYVVIDRLGMGGMGQVLRAYDPELDRPVALKVLTSAESGATTARLLEEARAAGKLVHPNVVTVFDVGVDAGQSFVAMELVEGGTLAAWLAEKRRTPRQILDVFREAGAGLAAAHRAGVVHRDFKPENVLLGKDGRPRVADFGLARWVPSPSAPTDEPKTITHVSGTPGYMAPEQYFRKSDARSDEYAFCVALWEALTGVRPFPEAQGEADPLRAMREEAPRGALPRGLGARARKALLKGLSFLPEHRFLSMEQLLEELRPRPSPLWIAAPLGVAVGAVAAAAWLLVPRPIPTAQVPAVEPAAADAPADGGPAQAVFAPDAATSQPPTAATDPADAGAAAAAVRPAKVFTPPRAKTTLAFRISPWAQVTLDGRKVGMTPLPPLEVSPGSHVVVLENSDLGARRTVPVHAKEGRQTTLRVDLLK